MENLEEGEQSATTIKWSAKKPKNLLPTEIIEEIFSRLPVKSILRFRTLSKPMLSRISDPSFTKLHFTRAIAASRTALFISAYDNSTRKHFFLSAAAHGGPVTHLMTLDDAFNGGLTEAEHLNGLVSFTCHTRSDYNNARVYAFVLNPSTHKILKLHDPYTDGKGYIRYLFGFHESRNEHKILMIRNLSEPSMLIMIFSLSSHSWRKIDAEPPVGFTWDSLYFDTYRSVCVNSVIHLMLAYSFDILAFDLRTEKFTIIKPPQVVLPHEDYFPDEDEPYIIKINGCVGVVCLEFTEENNEMHIWILQDYENRVWVREIITLPKPWIELGFPYPVDSVNMDEIIFSSGKYSSKMMSAPVYNKKSRCFKSLRFTSGHQFSLSRTLRFDNIRCYVESMVSL